MCLRGYKPTMVSSSVQVSYSVVNKNVTTIIVFVWRRTHFGFVLCLYRFVRLLGQIYHAQSRQRCRRFEFAVIPLDKSMSKVTTPTGKVKPPVVLGIKNRSDKGRCCDFCSSCSKDPGLLQNQLARTQGFVCGNVGNCIAAPLHSSL